MNIYIGSDHAGFDLKKQCIEYLQKLNFNLIDLGTYNNESCDYPDFAHAVALNVSSKKNTLGVLICGSANGVVITANKHKDIRAALCWNSEIASLSREHNDANILCLPARFITETQMQEICDKFFNTNFQGGRHLNRTQKINFIC